MEMWVLLFVIMTSGPRAATMVAEYYDKERCEAAGSTMAEAVRKGGAYAVIWRCTSKGEAPKV